MMRSFLHFLKTFRILFITRKLNLYLDIGFFWSEDEKERSDNESSSASDRMIKSVFSDVAIHIGFILQFWVPVTIGCRRQLSTSGQPFAVNHLDNDLASYRLRSLEYKYNIDETNNIDIEQNPAMIISGETSSAFLNRRLPEMVNFKEHGSRLDRYALESGLTTSYMLPICCPSRSTSCCIGVVEFSIELPGTYGIHYLVKIGRALEKVGLSVFHVQERIPYKSINGLKRVRDEIEEGLKIVCESHHIGLAQVWIASEDEYHLPFSSSLEDTRKKRMLALKLTGYIVDKGSLYLPYSFQQYYQFCDMLSLHTGEELVEKIFQDYVPRFCKDLYELNEDMLMAGASHGDDDLKSSALVICLRSSDTGGFDYVFEFIWAHDSSYLIFLVALLLTLKRCLPSFKFASGAELGDEIHVIDVNSTSETQTFKIFQTKKVSPIPEALENGKKRIVEDYPAHSKLKSKTTPIPLSQKDIEQQYGNTMKEAAKNLSVSVSTLKRKYRGYSNFEWPGPSVAKRKVNGSCNNQRDKIEEDNEAIQDPLAVIKKENTLIIKAEWKDDMIKFHLSISEATFVTVEKEIGMQFNLTMGTYKLKYLDEEGDWINFKTDQDMSNCIKSSRKLNQTVVRLRVQQSTQPIPGTSVSYEICRS